jgi:hypothetical protein
MSLYCADEVAKVLAGTIVLPSPPGGSDVVLAYGTNLVVGPLRPVAGVTPQLEVGVLQSGGAQPSPYLGNPESWHVSRVQVTVRSNVDEFQRGESLARALLAKAHRHEPTGVVSLTAVESDPLYLGADDAAAHRFAFNLDVGHRR